jgi:drug/metabolite transporter (DMT)-like permease
VRKERAKPRSRTFLEAVDIFGLPPRLAADAVVAPAEVAEGSRAERLRSSLAMQEVGDPRAAPPEWRVWLALWTVYIVWGSTYLGIRVVVETAPPLISAGARFSSAGLLVYAFLFLSYGRERVRLTLRQTSAAFAVGACLVLGGNGMVSIAEQTVPSSFAALIYASIPLWIVLFRLFARERPSNATLIGVAVGYLGLAILLLPGGRPGEVSVGGALMLCAGAFSWAIGSFYSRRLPLPDDAALATAATTICGGAVAFTVGLLAGEGSDLDFGALSARSLVGFVYLVLIGSVVGFSAYVWLLKNAPISKVATYAYVNPVVAVFLGWLILSEDIRHSSLIGAAVIVASVAFVVTRESADVGAGEGNVAPPGAGERASG